MRVWIVRHGEAEPRAASDAERALTTRGWEQARRVGRWLQRGTPAPQRIFASPYLRTRETASAIAEVLSLPVTETPLLLSEAEPGALLKWLEQHLEKQASALVLVSHQPLVSAFAGLLLEGDVHAGPPMGTGSIASLDVDLAAAGCARLHALQHAADLASGAMD